MTRVPLIFGAALFGSPSGAISRVHTLPECQKYIDLFAKYGGEAVDSSQYYGGGTTDEYLSQLDLKGLAVDTKIFPVKPHGFKAEAIRGLIEGRVKALAPYKIRYLYLHFPDRNINLDDTSREINELHKEGAFQEFGISNYNAWEVAEMYTICRLNGWVRPTVYQVAYNLLARGPELELVPMLRKFGIRLMIYNPLMWGGLLAGSNIEQPEPKGRFDKVHLLGRSYWEKFGHLVPAVTKLKETLASHQLRIGEASLRWLQHHSQLTETDGVLIGASSLPHVSQNCEDSEGGPLSAEVLETIEQAWLEVKATASHYAADARE